MDALPADVLLVGTPLDKCDWSGSALVGTLSEGADASWNRTRFRGRGFLVRSGGKCWGALVKMGRRRRVVVCWVDVTGSGGAGADAGSCDVDATSAAARLRRELVCWCFSFLCLINEDWSLNSMSQPSNGHWCLIFRLKYLQWDFLDEGVTYVYYRKGLTVSH